MQIKTKTLLLLSIALVLISQTLGTYMVTRGYDFLFEETKEFNKENKEKKHDIYKFISGHEVICPDRALPFYFRPSVLKSELSDYLCLILDIESIQLRSPPLLL